VRRGTSQPVAAIASQSPKPSAQRCTAHVAAAHAGIDRLIVNAASGATNTAEGSPWVLSTRRDDLHLTVYHATVPGSQFYRFKAVCRMPFHPAVTAQFLSDGAGRLRWDPNVSRLDTLPVADTPRGRVHLLHSQTKAVGPIASRDFVDVVAVVRTPSGGYANGGGSVTDARLPEQRGVVRGWNSGGGGWTFEPVEADAGLCTVTYVIHSDLKGWLPSLIINNAIVGNYVTFFSGALVAMREARLDSAESVAAALAALEPGDASPTMERPQ